MKNRKFDISKIIIAILLLFLIVLCFNYQSCFPKIICVSIGLLMLYGFYSIYQKEKDSGQNLNSTANIISIIFLAICFIPMGLLFMFVPFSENINNILNIEEDVKADGFTIEGYEVILDVGIDNKVEVTENIDVNFYESGHHGIYKFTPTWLKYTGKDGKTIKRKSNILNYRAEGNNYSVEEDAEKPKIKIGSSYRTVYGLNTYTIKYTYDMGSDPFNKFDEFIFHAFGDYWGTEIKNPKIVVNMPKDISGCNINVFTDKYRNNKVNNLVNIETKDSSVIITSNDLKLMKSLTVDIELPDNYFIEGSNNYGNLSFIISMIILGITGYLIYMWSKYGKNLGREVPTIEFYAPDNLNSAEIGYIYNDGKTNKKLTISLIIQIASKGYIKIDEIKDSKNKNSKIKISKLCSLNGESILENSNEHVNSSIENSVKKNIVDFSDNIIQSQELNTQRHIYNKLPELDEMEIIVYNKLFISSDEVILNDHHSFYEAFKDVDKNLKQVFNSRVYDVESQKKKSISLVISSMLLILSFISFFEVEDLNPSIQNMYYIAFGCVIVDYVLAFFMVKRTKYGEVVSSKVKGFREFLETVEKEKLESLVEQNPNYFYDILPYTFVLNISKKWIEKFQDIKIPNSSIGDFNYSDSGVIFNSIASSVYFPSSSSSRGSSSGGGCSSCGGGCSSCGGGGSW